MEQIDIKFTDSGCASCAESLIGRLQKVRGVDTVKATGDGVEIRLKPDNRVRLQTLRDFVEQGGGKVTAMQLSARGIVEKDGEAYILTWQVAPYNLRLTGRHLDPGATIRVQGKVEDVRPASGVFSLLVLTTEE